MRLISGGEGGVEGYINLADRLATNHTVIIDDRRGAMRSPVDDLAGEVTLSLHADDARRGKAGPDRSGD